MPFDIDVLLAQLMDPDLRDALTDPKVNQIFSRELVRLMPGISTAADAFGALGQAPMPDDPNRSRAQARMAAMDRLKSQTEGAVSREEEAKSEEASAAAADQDAWVRSVGYEPDPMLSEPDKGILFEEMPADKLLRLRKGAAPREEGYTGGTGSFSQGSVTPAIRAREAELKQWLAGQDERSARYDLTPEQQRRNPEGAQLASDRLVELQRNKQIESRQRSIDAIVATMSGNNGTVPFEQAKQLDVLGIELPYGAVGSSVQEADSFFDSVISTAGNAMAEMNPMDSMSDPAAEDRAMFEQYSAFLAEKYKRNLRNGMNPDDAMAELKRKLSQLAYARGLVNEADVSRQVQQIQQQAQAGQ